MGCIIERCCFAISKSNCWAVSIVWLTTLESMCLNIYNFYTQWAYVLKVQTPELHSCQQKNPPASWHIVHTVSQIASYQNNYMKCCLMKYITWTFVFIMASWGIWHAPWTWLMAKNLLWPQWDGPVGSGFHGWDFIGCQSNIRKYTYKKAPTEAYAT